jgi:alpha-1,3-mannosyltransferase
MKILHVVRQFYPAVGGMENAVLALCRHLQQRGHECDVVTLNRIWLAPNRLPAQEIVEHIQVFRISFIGRRRLFLAPEVLKHAPNYDLIHIHGVDFFVDFLALTKLLYRRPLVVSTYGGYFHTRWGYNFKRMYFRTITAVALSRAHKIICTSQHDYQLFNSIAARRKLTTIGVGIDKAFFSIRKECRAGMLVCIGRVAQNKHIERLIDVLALVRGSVPEAHLIIVGSDWEGLQPQLEARAQARGVSHSVQFVGQVAEATLKEYLAQAHLFVMASDYESFGIALLEAMSTGTVVVVNDIDTFHEFIVPGKNGFLTNFADLPVAAAVIVTALRLDIQQREAIGARARATARQFCWERIAELTEHVYRDSAAPK